MRCWGSIEGEFQACPVSQHRDSSSSVKIKHKLKLKLKLKLRAASLGTTGEHREIQLDVQACSESQHRDSKLQVMTSEQSGDRHDQVQVSSIKIKHKLKLKLKLKLRAVSLGTTGERREIQVDVQACPVSQHRDSKLQVMT